VRRNDEDHHHGSLTKHAGSLLLPATKLRREERGTLISLDSLVHFSIPVSDIAASTRFYTEIVGLKHLQTIAHGDDGYSGRRHNDWARDLSPPVPLHGRKNWHVTSTAGAREPPVVH
jgi:hypothetical protein